MQPMVALPHPHRSLEQPATGPRRRPPQVVSVVPYEQAEPFAAPVDWSSWVLTDEDDMGESPEQAEIIRLFMDILDQLATSEPWGQGKYVGQDAFFAWLPDHPLVRVSPDIYLLPAEPPRPLPGSFQTWRPGHEPPLFAVEVVSDDWKKDYELNPQKYALLGVQELVIFDPRPAAAKPGGARTPLQVYRRTEDGAFACTHRGTGPVALQTVPADLVIVETPRGRRLRLARQGKLLPTTREREEAARRRAEVERRRAEVADRRAEVADRRAEVERQRAEAALRELAALKARLEERS